MKKRICILILVSVLILLSSSVVRAQKFAIKTNLISLGTTTLNFGIELGLSSRWTLAISGSYNPWNFYDNIKIAHWTVQPEIRYWTCESFNGHFFGLHALGGEFNFAGVQIFEKGDYRYKGVAAGVGISYGYNWVLSKRWNIEASLGLGYISTEYDKIDNSTCLFTKEMATFVMPTRASISFVYIIK